jgi:hypothetical protein
MQPSVVPGPLEPRFGQPCLKSHDRGQSLGMPRKGMS